MITQEKIDQINSFARRLKAGETLTQEEMTLRDSLRAEYIAAVKQSLNGHLDNTYMVDEAGNKTKLKRKGE